LNANLKAPKQKRNSKSTSKIGESQLIPDEKAKKIKFKNTMAQIEKSTFQTSGVLGSEVTLKWVIFNNSKKDWPAFPLIKNLSQDFQLSSEVELLLKAKSKHEFEYKITLPTIFMEKFLTLNLSLVDPRKKERFGDPMIAIIEIAREENKSELEVESINDTDSQVFD
jgi:hypothetical protein